MNKQDYFLNFPLAVVVFGQTFEVVARISFSVTYDELTNQISFYTEDIVAESPYFLLTENFEDINLRQELARVVMDNEENWNNEQVWWTDSSDSKVTFIDSFNIRSKPRTTS